MILPRKARLDILRFRAESDFKIAQEKVKLEGKIAEDKLKSDRLLAEENVKIAQEKVKLEGKIAEDKLKSDRLLTIINGLVLLTSIHLLSSELPNNISKVISSSKTGTTEREAELIKIKDNSYAFGEGVIGGGLTATSSRFQWWQVSGGAVALGFCVLVMSTIRRI
jgi:hypothetical protein